MKYLGHDFNEDELIRLIGELEKAIDQDMNSIRMNNSLRIVDQINSLNADSDELWGLWDVVDEAVRFGNHITPQEIIMNKLKGV